MSETWKERMRRWRRRGPNRRHQGNGRRIPLGVATLAPITEDPPRPPKVTVVEPLPRQTSPQVRLTLSRPRGPLAPPQP